MLHEGERGLGLSRCADYGSYILGEAGSPLAWTCMKKFRSNAAIGPIAVATSPTVAPTASQRSAYLVYESNLHRQEGIGGIFCEFRRIGTDKYNGCIAQCEGLVKALQDFATV